MAVIASSLGHASLKNSLIGTLVDSVKTVSTGSPLDNRRLVLGGRFRLLKIVRAFDGPGSTHSQTIRDFRRVSTVLRTGIANLRTARFGA